MGHRLSDPQILITFKAIDKLTKTVLQVVIEVEILADRLFSMTLVQPPSLSNAANRIIHLSSK